MDEIIFHRKHPTVAEYCEKWLLMQSAKVSAATIKGYRQNMKNYVISSLGDMYMEEVTADDIRLALVPLSQKSKGLYDTVNMLIKCVFYSAERSQLITDNPCVGISAKGGKASKKKDALTDQQVAVLLDTVKELPPYLFIMIGLYSGLRREEILALQWDCVFLDESTPYISVRRAWRAEHNRPVISTVLKTKAAKRNIPIPKCLVDCLREAKANSISEYVIADSEGQPLSYSQFTRVWQYVVVRSAKERTYYKYVNGQSIKYTVKPTLGTTQRNNPKIRYELKMRVTIAASGQGRFNEELSFPYEARMAGLTPILVVFDSTHSPLLEKLQDKYIKEGGRCVIGDSAWTFLTQKAGSAMGKYILKYIKPPIEKMENEKEQIPGNIHLSAENGKIVISNSNGNEYEIPREMLTE